MLIIGKPIGRSMMISSSGQWSSQKTDRFEPELVRVRPWVNVTLILSWYVFFKTKNVLNVSLFWSKYSGIVYIFVLDSRTYQGFANYAKTTTYFLVVKGKIRGNYFLYCISGVLFMCIISQLTFRSPQKVAYLFITIQQLMEICERNDPILAPL